MKFVNIPAVAYKVAELDWAIAADIEVDADLYQRLLHASEVARKCDAQKIVIELPQDADVVFYTEGGDPIDVTDLALEVSIEHVVLSGKTTNGEWINSNPVSISEMAFAGCL